MVQLPRPRPRLPLRPPRLLLPLLLLPPDFFAFARAGAVPVVIVTLDIPNTAVR